MKRYFLSVLATIAIVVISIMPLPEVKIENVPLLDKWVHFIMYGGLCCVYWFDFFRNWHRKDEYSKWFLWIVLFPIVLGGVMELWQKYLTTCRNGDWIDFIANSVGVFLAIPLGLFVIRGIANRFMRK